jgi:hypothetical protein
MSRLVSLFIIAVVVLGVFAGCGGELEETYMDVSLREANFGQIASPGYKFSFGNTEFVAANGAVSVMREENLLEFFTGYGIENLMEGIKGRNYSVGVTKRFSPYVHYLVDFIVVGQDTTFVDPPMGDPLPNIVKGFDDTPYEEIDLEDLNYSTRTTSDIIDLQFKVPEARVTYEETTYDGDPEMAYILRLPNVGFIVDSPSEDAVLILQALMNEGYYFNGGVRFGDRPSNSTRNYRRANEIAGKVTVEYINYGDKVISTI